MKFLEQSAVALAALLSLASLQSAEAARLHMVSTGTAVDVIDQSASINTVAASRQMTGGLLDGSGADTVLLSDFQTFGPATVGPASVEDGYSHMVSVNASAASTSLSLDASHFWTASAANSANIDQYSLVQSLSHEGLRLRIEADAGEALGQAVRVSFNGQAQALLSGVTDTSDLGLTLDLTQGAQTLASYNGLWAGAANEAVNLSFSGVIGDEFTVSMSAFQSRQSGWQPLVGNTEVSGSLLMQGSFTVTAVPEPASWGLALAGLLVALGAARRRA